VIVVGHRPRFGEPPSGSVVEPAVRAVVVAVEVGGEFLAQLLEECTLAQVWLVKLCLKRLGLTVGALGLSCWLFALPRRGGRRLRVGRLPAAGALFVAIFVLGLTEGDALVPWDLPYVIPIVLVAGGVGAAGGVAAGGLATALAVGQAQIMGLDLGVVGVLVRALVFLVVGWVAGAGAKGTARVSEKEVARRVRRLADSAYVADPESSQARPRESQKLARSWHLGA